MTITQHKCDFCGAAIKAEDKKCRYCDDYGLVRLDGKGKSYVSFDLCQECLDSLKKELSDRVHI